MKNTDFWAKRVTLNNKPTVELRTERVINFIATQKNVTYGQAIEMVMKKEVDYDDTLVLLEKDYKNIILDK